jgi:hypothetical protein
METSFVAQAIGDWHLIRAGADAKNVGAMQATKLARAMVTKYGMSSSLGPTAIAYEDNGRSLSSETRAAVESEVCNLALMRS